jgi:type II secretory pathway predicted ATPase ExeA/pSer/pThr/pTyr-binding forkhead associated (FHA) protein
VYLEHFNLERNPFDQLPDPEFLYLTPQHSEALTRMQFALAINDSFTIVTGEVGSGKTTLVRKLLSDMEEKCLPAFVTHTKVSALELMQMILVELGVRPFDMGKTELLAELQRIVDEERQRGRRIVVVVDEAQNFSVGVLEELRLLTCMDTADSKAINIVLIGQPQLNDTIASPDLDQLRQRCRLRYHLNALSEEETMEYVRHRLTVAGGDPNEIFDALALASIYDHTRGIPRLVNTLCDTAMIMAYVAKRDKVTIDSIDDALDELAWEEAAPARGGSAKDQLDIHSTAHLAVTKRGRIRAEYKLNMPSYVVGRSDDCSIVIRSKYLSRHHALLARDQEGWMILDLRSTNGITVNGRKVQFARLADRDIVGIGEYLVRFSVHKPRRTVIMTNAEKTDVLTELPDFDKLAN